MKAEELQVSRESQGTSRVARGCWCKCAPASPTRCSNERDAACAPSAPVKQGSPSHPGRNRSTAHSIVAARRPVNCQLPPLPPAAHPQQAVLLPWPVKSQAFPTMTASPHSSMPCPSCSLPWPLRRAAGCGSCCCRCWRSHWRLHCTRQPPPRMGRRPRPRRKAAAVARKSARLRRPRPTRRGRRARPSPRPRRRRLRPCLRRPRPTPRRRRLPRPRLPPRRRPTRL